MHKYQKLQDLIIKFPTYTGQTPLGIENLDIKVNYNLAVKNKKSLIYVIYLLYIWTGMYPTILKARHSMAAFSIRKGMPIGAGLTLHGSSLQLFLNYFFFNLAQSSESVKFTVANSGPAFLGFSSIFNLQPLAFTNIDYRILHSFRPFGLSLTINFKSKGSGLKNRKTMTHLHQYILSQYLIPTKIEIKKKS